MSHSQFRSETLILRHAWLNLWDKHMTTGRINQVTFFGDAYKTRKNYRQILKRGLQELQKLQRTKPLLLKTHSLIRLMNHDNCLPCLLANGSHHKTLWRLQTITNNRCFRNSHEDVVSHRVLHAIPRADNNRLIPRRHSIDWLFTVGLSCSVRTL